MKNLYLFFRFLKCCSFILVFNICCHSVHAQVTVYTENFEHGSNMPSGWSQEYVYDTLNWIFTSGGQSGHPSAAHGGSYNALLYYGGIYRTTKLICKPLNLTPYSNLQLKFWHTQEEYSGDQDKLKVFYKTSASGSWVQLASYTTNVSSWTQRTITLPNPSSNYYIAFEGEARYGYGVCVDDVLITGTVSNGLDISCVSISSPLIWGVGNNTLKISYKNMRSDTIFNADFGYKLDTNTAVIDTNKSTGTLLANQEKDYTFPASLSISKGNHYIKVWANKPNRTNPDDVPANDTFTLNFGTGIKDTFYIDKSGQGDYTTFAAAVADLNNGVTGPVWFIVKPGTYTEKVVIGEIPGADSTNTITFDGLYKDSTFLSYTGTSAANRATLSFKGADYVTFKNMTIKNEGNTYAVAVLLRNKSDHNTFFNCNLKLKTTVTSGYAQVILASAKENSTGANGDNCNYTSFENCLIEGGQYGARMHGTNTASMAVNNSFVNCNFTNQWYFGLYLYYQQGFNISYCKVANFRHASAYGLINYYGAGSNIDGNSIQAGIHALYLYRENYYKQNNSSYVTNNMICNFKNTVYQRGIYAVSYCYNLNILHNSILVNGTSTSPTYAAIYIYYYCNNSVIKNNLLASLNKTNILAMLYAGTVSVDYNDYYYDTNSNVKFYINYSYANFNTFKSIASYINYPHDLNSFDNVNPGFVSNTNLHLDTLSSISLMAPAAGISNDFDNESRNLNFGVNLGADEIPHPNRDLDIISIDTPAVLKSGSNIVSITLRNMGTDSIVPQKLYLNYRLNGGNPVNDSLTLSSKLPPFGSIKFSFQTPVNITGSGSYEFCVQLSPGIYNDPDSLDELCVTKCLGKIDTFMIDPSGNGDFTTIMAAVNSLQTCGISGAVTFILKAGTYVERVVIPEIPGANSVRTVTFQGVHKDSVVLVHAGTSTAKSVILLNSADHIVIKNMRVLNNGNSYASCIHFMNGADSNTVENCDLTVSTATSSYKIPVIASNSELYYNTYGNTANGNLIKNNKISGGYHGICMVGTDKNNLCWNNRIIGNTIKDQYYMGIYNIYQGNTEIIGNSIKNLDLYYAYGIYRYYCTKARIESNVIQPGRIGIYLNRENNLFPDNSTHIINNMISNFNDGTYQAGIYTYYYSTKLKIYHNSIYLDGNVSSITYAGLSLYYYCDSAIVKNNLIASDGSNYLMTSYISRGTIIDYNSYYAPNNTSYKFYNSASFTNLSAYKNSTAYLVYPHNVNSFENINPGFISLANLHLSSNSAGIGGDTLGILYDIDGDYRCQASPSLGADEAGPVSDFSINSATQCMDGHIFILNNTSQGGTATLSYFWTFGDGDTSTLRNPVHSYASPGTYTITLIVYPSFGCSDTTSKTVTVNPSPQIGFTVNDSTQCLQNNNFNYQNTTTISSGSLTYNWNFGDGYSAGVQNPTHSYGYSDTFAVRLIVGSDLGCVDTLIKNMYVFPMPDADFTINSGAQCKLNNNFIFTNTTSISSGTLTFFWDFGDGNTSTQMSPAHSYAANGNYDVKLTATSAFGCMDSALKNTFVYPTPTATFTVNDTDQCLNGNLFQITNSSFVSSGSLTYYWTFGDGNSSSQSNPSYSYSATGTYLIKLIVSTTNSCVDSAQQYVIVHPSLIADFSINNVNQCLKGNNYIFTNATTTTNGTMSYYWDFGDGSVSTSTSPTHVYSIFGALDVKLVASSTNSCSDTISKPVQIYSMPLNVKDTSLSNRLSDSLLAWYPFIGNVNDHSGLSNNGTVYGASLSNDQCSRSDSAYYFDGNDYLRVPHAVFLIPQNSYAASAWIYPTQSGGTQYILYKYQSNLYKGYSIALYNNKIAADFGGSLNPVYSTQSVNLNEWNHIVVSYDGWNYKMYLNNQVVGSGIAANNFQSITPLYIGSRGTANYFKGYLDEVRIYDKSLDNVEINALYHEIPYVQLKDTFVCSGNSTSIYIHNSGVGIGYQLKDYGTGSSIGSVVYGNGCRISLSTGTISSQKQIQIVATDSSTSCQQIFDTLITIILAPVPTAAFTVSPTSSCLSGNHFTLTNSSSVSFGSLQFKWDFGDLNTSTLTSPTHQYTYADTFTIKLTTTTTYGCSDSLEKSVRVFPQPNADFTIADSIQCLGNNAFAFVNNSTILNDTLSYLWDFGDGNKSTTKNPVHSYSYADTFQVKLIVSSGNGCTDSMIKTTYLHVNPNPTAGFSINDSTQCLNENNISLTNSSSISAGTMNFSWRLGDGNTSTATNPSYQYSAYDTFDITLLVVSDKGCTDSVMHQAYIYPNPNSSFSINDTVQCFTGNVFSFTNLTSIPYGSFTSWWSFGDGSFSTTSNPTHSFTQPDTFTVQLLSTSNYGCLDSVQSNAIVEPSPVAGFTVNDTTQCLDGNSFSFTDLSVGGSGTIYYYWTFGDGSGSTAQNPVHSYSTAGTYQVKLLIHYGAFCKDSMQKQIVVYPTPIADFSVNDSTQCLTNNSLSFTNLSSITSGSMSYFWTFGDGSSSTATNPTHSYNTDGTYQVQLLVISSEGCSDSISSSIQIWPVPTASFSINNTSQCFGGNSFGFNNTSSIKSGSLTYLWTFGDGNSSSSASPSYSYSSPGSYSVKLVVSSAYSCQDSVTQNVLVSPMPIADFTISNDTQCLDGNTFYFYDSSIISSGSISYNWNFGDGSTSNLQNPGHSYLNPGSYAVKLLISSDKGCLDSLSKTALVNPNPVVSFSVNDTDQCLNINHFVISNNSSISSGTLSYSWDFGDGSSSDSSNPVKQYSTANTFTIKLIVNSNNYCTDSMSQKVIVFPNPQSDFSVNSDSQCFASNQFVFTNSSSIAAGSLVYLWSFGDSQNDTAQHPVHSYASNGSYQVQLISSSPNGCVDTATKSMTVLASPEASFTVNDTDQCLTNNSFVLSNTSTINSGNLYYLWDFGDNSTSASKDTNHTYATDGIYQLKLLVSSGFNCSDSAYQALYVYPIPVVDFSINDTNQCLTENLFALTNTSSISTGNISHFWSFGDSDTSTSEHPDHSYSSADTFAIKLIVSSTKSCKDSIEKKVVVLPSPFADFTINDSDQCYNGHQYIFMNQSQISSGSLVYLWTFGDGDSSLSASDTHVYQSAGVYQVSLFVNSNSLCADTLVKSISLMLSPKAGFMVNDSGQCDLGNSFVFTNSSTGLGANPSYLWYFGDGDTSSSPDPTHSYATTDSFKVKLLVSTQDACEDSLMRTMFVYPTPSVDFAINLAVQCYGSNDFKFTNLTPIIALTSWIWDFGDGDTSQSQHISHTYKLVDTFAVSLMATTDHLCSDTLFKQVITLPGPKSLFTVNDTVQCLNSNTYNFVNTSQSVGFTPHYYWYFGDGDTSTMTHVSHVYQDTGSYLVQLIAVPDTGCADTSSLMVHVQPLPDVNFTVNSATQCLNSKPFVFTNQSNSYGYQNTAIWNFGDGVYDSAISPSHIYADTGSYTVYLVIEAGVGCKDSNFMIVQVFDNPVADFAINDTSQCFSMNSFVFTNNSSGLGSLKYSWEFGDGNTSSSAGPVSNAYLKEGIYTVSLVAETGIGCQDTISKLVYVHPQPLAGFSINDTVQCSYGNHFITSNHTTISSGNLTYLWSFGDGRTSSSKEPRYNYPMFNTYVVKMVATSDEGCSDSSYRTVYVLEDPNADFTFNKQEQCLLNNHFVLLNNSSISSGSLSFLWDFGGGDTSSYVNTSHIYLTSGIFDVILIVTSDSGCVDSVIKQCTVHPNPDADFYIDKNPQCQVGNLFKFTSTSSITSGTLDNNWYFGDGDSSMGLDSSTHSYKSTDSYDVMLVALSDHQCGDTLIKTVSLTESPKIDLGKDIFTVPNVSINIDAGPGYSTYLWHDNSTGQFYTVNTNNLGIGDHLIFVTVTDSKGCWNSDSIWIFIWPSGIDEFSDLISYKLFPNPARGFFHIEFNELYDAEVEVVVEDIQGREVFNSKFNPLRDNSSYRVDLDQAKGIYLVKMVIGNKVKVHKVMMY
ncbi:MAG: PKD domain-containing protein [Bacteroidetes bacterium]|nr:PKD domain-containing protein [Bacteroidota bacterium]